MAEERVEPKPIDLGEYKFGFHDDVQPILSTGKGLNEAVIRELSAAKNEPEWMLEFRLKSFETFKKMPMQTWGADLSEIDFDDLIYYQKPSDKPARSWDEVPEKIKETFERIGIPEAERVARGITNTLLRFSVGLEDVEDIKADLLQAFAQLK